MKFVMRLVLDACTYRANIKTTIVYVDAPDNASIETLVKLAEAKAKKSIPGFENSYCLDYTYLGCAESVYIIK